jgi:hypothetical protein
MVVFHVLNKAVDNYVFNLLLSIDYQHDLFYFNSLRSLFKNFLSTKHGNIKNVRETTAIPQGQFRVRLRCTKYNFLLSYGCK